MRGTKALFFLIVLVALSFFVSSCASKANQEVKGLERISDVNNTILLKSEISEGNLGTPIRVLIVNTSQEPLYFSSDYGLQVFALLQNEWQRLPARVIPAREQGLVLPPLSEGGMEQVLLYPEIPSHVKTITLHIVIQGRKNTPSGEPVGAYLDLTLHRAK